MQDFDEFVRVRGQALLRFAYLVTGNQAAAEEAVQEALSRAWPRWDRISHMDSHEAYVRRMIVNAHISWWRRFHREVAVDEVRDPSGASAGASPDHGSQAAERDAIWTLLQRLPRKQRTAVVLRHYEGLSDREIASLLECPESTVRSQIHRALITLRGWLEDERSLAHG